MANKFQKSSANKTIQNVAKANSEMATVVKILNVNTSDIVDYPQNNEDISNTVDLEISIKENGFFDPLHVTDYGMEKGKYMIVSGHRRRSAGVKCGIEVFPVIVKSFENDYDLKNYVLMANAQRNAVADPLLLCARYLRYQQLEEEKGFTGSKGELNKLIADKLGISPQQAERYKTFNRIISPCWDLVREDKVGMNSLLKMAQYTEDEQFEIYSLLVAYLKDNSLERIERTVTIQIIDNYKNGVRSLEEIEITKKEDTVPVKQETNVVSFPKEKEQTSQSKRNDETNYEGYKDEDVSKQYKEEELNEDDIHVIQNNKKHETNLKNNTTDKKVDESVDHSKKVLQAIDNLESTLNKSYDFEEEDSAILAMHNMSCIVSIILGEMETIAHKHKLNAEFEKMLAERLEEIKLTLGNK